jgi:hypothetical protein
MPHGIYEMGGSLAIQLAPYQRRRWDPVWFPSPPEVEYKQELVPVGRPKERSPTGEQGKARGANPPSP